MMGAMIHASYIFFSSPPNTVQVKNFTNFSNGNAECQTDYVSCLRSQSQ